MKRTIIYVFGPARLAGQYRECSEILESNNSSDVTNWLKIGLTTTQDDSLDKWDAAKKRIDQESRTGLSETCRILDVFEYPFVEGKPDDEVRRIMTEDAYTLQNSKTNNGLIVNKYEIKAGQEFVYGASRSHVLAAIAKFERNLVVKYRDKEIEELYTLIDMIKRNLNDDVDASEDDEDNTTNSLKSSSTVDKEIDAFYDKIIEAMPEYIKEKCNNSKGKNYMTIRTKRDDCKWYYLTFNTKNRTTSIRLETYGGTDDRDSVEKYIEENNIKDKLPQLRQARQGKTSNKFSWDINGEYDIDDQTVINWFVVNTKSLYDAFEANVNNQEELSCITKDVIKIQYEAPYKSFGPQTPILNIEYDYSSQNLTPNNLSEKTKSELISFLCNKQNIDRFFNLPDINEGFHDNMESLTISYNGKTKTISQNIMNRKYEHPFQKLAL